MHSATVHGPAGVTERRWRSAKRSSQPRCLCIVPLLGVGADTNDPRPARRRPVRRTASEGQPTPPSGRRLGARARDAAPRRQRPRARQVRHVPGGVPARRRLDAPGAPDAVERVVADMEPQQQMGQVAELTTNKIVPAPRRPPGSPPGTGPGRSRTPTGTCASGGAPHRSRTAGTRTRCPEGASGRHLRPATTPGARCRRSSRPARPLAGRPRPERVGGPAAAPEREADPSARRRGGRARPEAAHRRAGETRLPATVGLALAGETTAGPPRSRSGTATRRPAGCGRTAGACGPRRAGSPWTGTAATRSPPGSRTSRPGSRRRSAPDPSDRQRRAGSGRLTR